MHRLNILFICCLVIFTDMVGYSIITPSIPLFAKLFKASDTAISFAFAAYPVAFLITILPFGFLVDRVGRNHLIIGLGMFSLAAACLSLVLAESIATFSLGRAFQGIGSAASWVAAQPLAAQQIDASKKKGLEISSITIAYGLGMILGPLLGSIGSLRTPFYINFFLAAGVGLVAVIWLKGAEMSERMMELYASLGMMEVLFPLYMDSLAYAKASIGMLFLILSIFLVIGQPATGFWMERSGPHALILTGYCCLAGSLSLMIVCAGFRGWVPVFMVFGVTIGALISASMLLIAQNSRPGEQGAAYGMWNFSFSVGYLWGPALGGMLSDFSHSALPSMGFKTPFFFFSFLIICCAVLFKLLFRKPEKG
ncbi:MAG: MFS transporter [Proteobacteria bacterium]|nr:MFS transporter [Pseudomonadota bacterium]